MGRAVSAPAISTKMKFLWVLIVAVALVAADDDDDDDDTQITGVDTNVNDINVNDTSVIETIVSNSTTAGRSGSRPNSRIFGGLGNLIGAGAALLGGVLGGGRPVRPPVVQPGFIGGNPGFGGINPGLAGGNPGFGGINPGLGGTPPGFGGPVTGGCRYWCRTPQGQTYCCENANQAATVPFLKPGRCPPVRPSCPPTRNFFGPPQTCSNDGRCPGVDKCCFDTCLQEHVCKPPLGVGK